MDVTGEEPEEGQADVDEQVRAAACNEKDTNRWDYGAKRGGLDGKEEKDVLTEGIKSVRERTYQRW